MRNREEIARAPRITVSAVIRGNRSPAVRSWELEREGLSPCPEDCCAQSAAGDDWVKTLMGRCEQFPWPHSAGESGNEARKTVSRYCLSLDACGCSWRIWEAMKTFE